MSLGVYPFVQLGNGILYAASPLFGSSREARSQAKIQASASDLRQRIQGYTDKIVAKNKEKEQLLAMCRQFVKDKNKQRAMAVLKETKIKDKEMVTLQAVVAEMQKMHDTLTHQLLASEVVEEQRVVAAVMKKHVNGDLITRAEKVHDDIADADDTAEELRELMNSWNMHVDNDDDIEKELETIEEEMLDEVLIGVDQPPQTKNNNDTQPQAQTETPETPDAASDSETEAEQPLLAG